MKPYQIFDHTADIGLILRGKNLEDFFRNAGLGLFSLITDVETLRWPSCGSMPSRKVVEESLSLEADSVEELLFAWLRELLYLFSSKGLVFFDYHFTKISETSLTAKLGAAAFDSKKREPRHEVKAVTRHQFKVTKTRSGWRSQVILDI